MGTTRSLLELLTQKYWTQLELALQDLNLHYGVSSRITHAQPPQGLNLGIVGISEGGIALFAGAQGASFAGQPINALLIPPVPQGMSWDGQFLATNYCFVLCDGVIRPILSEEPIPIDGVWSYGTPYTQHVFPENMRINNSHLAQITRSKDNVAMLLSRHGVQVPDGIVVQASDKTDIRRGLTRMFREHEEIVVKPTDSFGGQHVRFFEEEEFELAAEYIYTTIKDPDRALIEGRIKSTFHEGTQPMDWNIRSLVTMPYQGEPVWIDAEIRYRPLGKEPVNICQGAKARDIHGMLSILGVSEDTLKEKSEHVARIIAEEMGHRGNSSAGFLGIDLIGKDLIVMEVNSQNVGGFGTLTRLRKQPLTSIRDKLMPTLGHWLNDNTCGRAKTYTAMPWDSTGANRLATYIGEIESDGAALQFLATISHEALIPKYLHVRMYNFWQSKKYAEVIDLIGNRHRTHVLLPDTYVALAHSYCELAQFDNAIEAATLGESNHQEGYLAQTLAAAHMAAYRATRDEIYLEPAIKASERARERGYNPIELTLDKAIAHLYLGQHAEAIVEYELALSIDPNNLGPYIRLMQIYSILSDEDKMEECRTRAIEACPEDKRDVMKTMLALADSRLNATLWDVKITLSKKT